MAPARIAETLIKSTTRSSMTIAFGLVLAVLIVQGLHTLVEIRRSGVSWTTTGLASLLAVVMLISAFVLMLRDGPVIGEPQSRDPRAIPRCDRCHRPGRHDRRVPRFLGRPARRGGGQARSRGADPGEGRGRWSQEEYLGLGWLEAVHPKDRPRVTRDWAEAVAGRLYENERRLRRKDGVYRYMYARGVPIVKEGQVREWVGLHADVTQRKEAEEELRQAKEEADATNRAKRHHRLQRDAPRDGLQALSAARDEAPDLILMDMNLLEMGGWEATRRIRFDPITGAIPVIALTAHGMASDRQKVLEAGCDDHHAKPVDLTRLLGQIEAHLQRTAQ